MFGSLVIESVLPAKGQAIPLGEDKLLCSRLTPPPVPPWLLDSPDKLRHLVSNCSSWQTYSKLCAKDLQENFPALWTIAHASEYHESHGVQWIPAMVMLIISAILVLVAFCGYFLYRHDSIVCKLRPWWRRSVKYQQQLTPTTSTTDYCSPGLSLTPSVTVETQLSLWALEDHHADYNVRTPFSLDADPSLAILTSAMTTTSASSFSVGTPHNNHISHSFTSDSGEVLLQPQRLADTQLHLVDVLPNLLTRGHPVDTSYPSLELELAHDRDRGNAATTTERYCELPMRNNNKGQKVITSQSWGGDVNTNSPSIVQPSPNTELLDGKRKGRRTYSHQGLLKTCQNAGSKLVNKLSRRPSLNSKDSNRSRSRSSRSNTRSKTKQNGGTGQKIEASFARFRQSLSDSKLSRQLRSASKSHGPNSPSFDIRSSPANAKDAHDTYSSTKELYSNSQYTYLHNENSTYQEDSVIPKDASSLMSKADKNSSPDTPVVSPPNNSIYSYAGDIPSDSSTSSNVKRTKRSSSLLPRRPRFLKINKLFGKS